MPTLRKQQNQMSKEAKKAWVIWLSILLAIFLLFSCGSKHKKITEKIVINERVLDSIKTDSFRKTVENSTVSELIEKYKNIDTSSTEKFENITTSTIDFEALEHEVLEIETPEGKTTIKGTGKVNITTQSSRVTMKELAIELGERTREFYIKEKEHKREMNFLSTSIAEKTVEVENLKMKEKKVSSFLKYSLIANVCFLLIILLLIYLWYRKKDVKF